MIKDFYPWLKEQAIAELQNQGLSNPQLKSMLLGLNWSMAAVQWDESTIEHTVNESYGLCFSPTATTRVMDWPGTLVGQPVGQMLDWITEWDPCKAVVATATLNAVVNSIFDFQTDSLPLANLENEQNVPPHLAVFNHFAPQLKGAKIAIIGHYPGIERYQDNLDITCIERNPRPGDLPDPAVEYVLPESDWVFITASSIANKTLPRLLQLSRESKVVLMGPSLPWLASWKEWGVDYLAGVEIINPTKLQQTVAEGGGTRIFQTGVNYRLMSLT